MSQPPKKKMLANLLRFVGFRDFTSEEETVSNRKPDANGRTPDQRVAEIWEKHRQAMFRTARANTRSEPDAEDVVQNVFLSFVKNGIPDDAYENLPGYLHTAVMNECKKFYRTYDRQRIDPYVDVMKLEIPAPQPVERDISLTLQRAKAALRDDERAILDMFYEEGRSSLEIAEIQQTTEGQVKMKLSRARQKVGKLMGYFEQEADGRTK